MSRRGLWYQGGHDWKAEPLPRDWYARRAGHNPQLTWDARMAAGHILEDGPDDPYENPPPWTAVGSAIVTAAMATDDDQYGRSGNTTRANEDLAMSTFDAWRLASRYPDVPWAGSRFVARKRRSDAL